MTEMYLNIKNIFWCISIISTEYVDELYLNASISTLDIQLNINITCL